MRGLRGYQSNLSLFPYECEVKTGKFFPYIHPDEGKFVSMSCNNPLRENIITCKDPYKNEFLEEVDGLSLDLKLSSALKAISDYIPILDIRTSKDTKIPKNFPFVGITLSDLIRSGIVFKAGRLHVQTSINFRNDILMNEGFRGKKTILFLSGSDSLIETVWHERNDSHLFEMIRNIGFWAVSSINFSVFNGECAFSHALNQKRSLYSAFLMEQTGVKVIPHIYAISQFHIERWISWFERNPAITYFTMNCQLQKKKEDIHQAIFSINAILQRLKYIHVILQGFPIREIASFGENINRIHFADAQPIKYAQSHKQILRRGEAKGKRYEFDFSKDFNELALENIGERAFRIRQFKEQIINSL